MLFFSPVVTVMRQDGEKALSVAPDYLTALRGAAASYAVMRRLNRGN